MEGIREAAVNNPVFILEAVDRVADDEDEVNAVLGLLDRGRRLDFGDAHPLASFDLSGVLWIVTATDLAAVPEPIRNRLTVVEFPSYTEREKLEIARKHLLKHPFDRPPSAAGGA